MTCRSSRSAIQHLWAAPVCPSCHTYYHHSALHRAVVRLGNLNTRRDFTYISDTVHGFLLAAQAPGIEGQTFNLGTGSEARIADLAQQIIQLTAGQSRSR